MVKHGYMLIDGINFPTTTFEDGLFIVDYPIIYSPKSSKKITEERKIQMEKLNKLFEEYNLKNS